MLEENDTKADGCQMFDLTVRCRSDKISLTGTTTAWQFSNIVLKKEGMIDILAEAVAHDMARTIDRQSQAPSVLNYPLCLEVAGEVEPKQPSVGFNGYVDILWPPESRSRRRAEFLAEESQPGRHYSETGRRDVYKIMLAENAVVFVCIEIVGPIEKEDSARFLAPPDNPVGGIPIPMRRCLIYVCLRKCRSTAALRGK